MSSFFILHLFVFVAGLILRTFPPNKINWFYGYRTNSSTKNEEVFKYANKVSSELLMLFSTLAFAISFISMEFFNFSKLNWLIFVGIALTIIITESKIKKLVVTRK